MPIFHEKQFIITGTDIFDGAPIVTDQVKFSELQWQDEDGKSGTFNFTNPKWAEPQINTSPKKVLFYDSQDFYNRHHSDEWYETDDLLYEDEPYTWFDENVELKDAKSVSDKDYYDFLMQLYAEQQQEKNAANVPIIVKGFDTRKKKSVDIATKSPESDVKEPEPCTVRSLRLCNIFFTIPLITVIVIVLVAVYFFALFCYLQVSVKSSDLNDEDLSKSKFKFKQKSIPVGCISPIVYCGGSFLAETPLDRDLPVNQKATPEYHNRRPLSTRMP